jgi:hemerythrin superfamily protein
MNPKNADSIPVIVHYIRESLKMKTLLYFIVIILLSRCREKDKPLQQPISQNNGLPASLVNEHRQLLSQAKAMTAGGDSIAVELYKLIEYHFREEEQYVFPVLGILPSIASGNIPEKADSIIGLVKVYQSNASKLLAEHQMIEALLGEYRLRSGDTTIADFEKQLAQHALAEEEIYFPAAVLVGEYLKLKK